MSLIIDSGNKSDNKLVISGKSINNKSFFTTYIEWNTSFEKISPNEGCFSVIIPENNKLYKITTTLFSSRPSLCLENNIITKKIIYLITKNLIFHLKYGFVYTGQLKE